MSDQIFYTEGAKNTFFLTFSNKLDFEFLKKKALDLGLDPDGYILAPKVSENLVKFKFYNKDSSLVDFCGNALRAVGLCFFDQFNQKKVQLHTDVGAMWVEVLSDNEVKAQMPKPEDKGLVEIDDHKASYVLSGVPHLVFNAHHLGFESFDLVSIREFCFKVRKMSLGDKKETFNLSFYALRDSYIECVTFERGVEDFTQACGSGALSVFRALNEEHSNLKMPGGMLKVYKEDGVYYMQGPAMIHKRLS